MSSLAMAGTCMLFYMSGWAVRGGPVVGWASSALRTNQRNAMVPQSRQGIWGALTAGQRSVTDQGAFEAAKRE
jgi:hypothetical protein